MGWSIRGWICSWDSWAVRTRANDYHKGQWKPPGHPIWKPAQPVHRPYIPIANRICRVNSQGFSGVFKWQLQAAVGIKPSKKMLMPATVRRQRTTRAEPRTQKTHLFSQGFTRMTGEYWINLSQYLATWRSVHFEHQFRSEIRKNSSETGDWYDALRRWVSTRTKASYWPWVGCHLDQLIPGDIWLSKWTLTGPNQTTKGNPGVVCSSFPH